MRMRLICKLLISLRISKKVLQVHITVVGYDSESSSVYYPICTNHWQFGFRIELQIAQSTTAALPRKCLRTQVTVVEMIEPVLAYKYYVGVTGSHNLQRELSLRNTTMKKTFNLKGMQGGIRQFCF